MNEPESYECPLCQHAYSRGYMKQTPSGGLICENCWRDRHGEALKRGAHLTREGTTLSRQAAHAVADELAALGYAGVSVHWVVQGASYYVKLPQASKAIYLYYEEDWHALRGILERPFPTVPEGTAR